MRRSTCKLDRIDRERRTRPENPGNLPNAKPAPYWWMAGYRAVLILGALIFFPQFVGGMVGMVIMLAIVGLVLREAWH